MQIYKHRLCCNETVWQAIQSFDIQLVLGEYENEENLSVISMKFINWLKNIILTPHPTNPLQISKALLLVSCLTVPECRPSSTAKQRSYNCYKKLQITQMKYWTDRSGGVVEHLGIWFVRHLTILEPLYLPVM